MIIYQLVLLPSFLAVFISFPATATNKLYCRCDDIDGLAESWSSGCQIDKTVTEQVWFCIST